MTFLKISLPVYKKDKWERLDKNGKIEVSSEVDNLSDGYESLKIQIDNLLAELDGQNRLAHDCEKLNDEVNEKTRVLKNLTRNIEIATAHYESLRFFLNHLGIDPDARPGHLTFDQELLLQDASHTEEVFNVEVEVDPIPFDSLAGADNNPHEF